MKIDICYNMEQFLWIEVVLFRILDLWKKSGIIFMPLKTNPKFDADVCVPLNFDILDRITGSDCSSALRQADHEVPEKINILDFKISKPAQVFKTGSGFQNAQVSKTPRFRKRSGFQNALVTE